MTAARRAEDVPGGERGERASVPVETRPALSAGDNTDPAPAAEAEAAAGAEARREAFDQTLAAAVRERDRALDRATSRLASVTAGGYLEYDRSVSVALAAFESAWHNARQTLAAAG